MGRRKISENHIRKVTRMGGGKSLGITFPIEIARKAKLRERQKLTVKLRGKKIIVEDWKG